MLKFKEISLANVQRIYNFKKNLDYEISFGIKGFDYGWLLTSRKWKQGEKVLDVGGAYSDFPSYLNRQFGCETWVVDDFGIDVNDPFWQRNMTPKNHVDAHPENKYVLERVGDPDRSSLPTGYFDVVYSASALEHVPPDLTPAVWKHMYSLLAPQGELIHAIDIPLASNGGLGKMFQATIFDAVPWLFPYNFQLNHYLATPRNYVRLVSKALNFNVPTIPDFNIWKVCLDPDILCESLMHGWYRITKDKMTDYRFQRVGSLLLHFVKA